MLERIERLADDSRPIGCGKLAGRADQLRIRQGDFRVLYAVDDRDGDVIRLGHRRDVYR